MKTKIYAIVLFSLTATIVLCFAKNDNSNKKRQSQPRQNQNQQMTYEQIKQEDHRQTCNILGFASNIFNNFVRLVSNPNSKENVGIQVGNMAANIYLIVAEASKSIDKTKSNINQIDILDYLQSEQFKQDLTKIILKKLEEIKN